MESLAEAYNTLSSRCAALEQQISLKEHSAQDQLRNY